ncbi:MAG: hypothetical protein WC395_07285 [Bacteroidales bacterium]|jgi:hypothetical protein
MKESNNKWTDTVRDKVNGLPEVLDTNASWGRMERKILAFYRIRLLKRTGLAAACVAAILVPVFFWNSGGAGMPEQPVRIVQLHHSATGLTCKAERPVHTIYILPGPPSSDAQTDAQEQAPEKVSEAQATVSETQVTVSEAQVTVSETQPKPAGEKTKTPPVYTADPFAQPYEQTRTRRKFMVSAAGLLNVSRGGAEGALPMNDLLMSDNRLTTYGITQKETGLNAYDASFASVSFVQYEYKHRMPVSFGIYASLPLSERWFVESGLFATRLATSIYSETYVELKPSNSEPVFITDRVLWYLGIPLKIRWNFVQKKYFTAYASAGGMLEKCVSFDYTGNIDDENMQFTTGQIPLQWSVNATLGAQYNIINILGLFVEPGISFFPDSHNPVHTIRGERPLYFNLNAGVRFMF